MRSSAYSNLPLLLTRWAPYLRATPPLLSQRSYIYPSLSLYDAQREDVQVKPCARLTARTASNGPCSAFSTSTLVVHFQSQSLMMMFLLQVYIFRANDQMIYGRATYGYKYSRLFAYVGLRLSRREPRGDFHPLFFAKAS